MLKRDKNIFTFIALLIVRIPLSYIIGDNGMGYLSGPMEMVLLLGFLFSSGFLSTMQGMMKDRIRRDQYKNASQVFKYAQRIAIICALVLLVINIAGYDFISTRILLDNGQRLAYLCVGPVLCVSIFLSVNKGYLNGNDNIAATVKGEIIESILIIALMIIGALIGQKYGNKVAILLHYEDVASMYGALGAMIGLFVAEFISLLLFLVMVIIYQRSFRHMMKSDSTRRYEHSSDISGRLLFGMLQDGLQNFVLQAIIIVMIIMFRKASIASETENINSFIGSFYSKILSVIGIICSLTVLYIPSGVRGVILATNDGEDNMANERLVKLLAKILYFTIPATIYTIILSPVIIDSLFKGMVSTVKTVLPVGSICIILYPILFMLIMLLNKLNYHKEVLFMTSITLIITSIISFIFINKQARGMMGMMIILIIAYSLNLLMCLFVLLRNMRFRFVWINYFLMPLLISGVIALVIKLLSGLLVGVLGSVLTLIICIIPAWIIYNIACMFLHVVSASQMERKVFGRIFVSIGQNLGIY